MLTGLFTSSQKKIGNIFVDANIEESHVNTSEVTQYPVESGVTLSDHIILRPFILKLKSVISNNDLRISFGASNLSNSGRAVQAYDQLLAIRRERIELDVVTHIRSYTNMVITELTPFADIEQSDGLFFTITLQQILKSSELNFNDNLTDDARDTYASNVSRGRQTGIEVPEVDAQSVISGLNVI